MKKISCALILILHSISAIAQEEPFNPDDFEDGSTVKKYCTQKVLNQTPTKLIGIAYEYTLPFSNKENTKPPSEQKMNGMGGLRALVSFLPISKNNFILNVGANYWASTPMINHRNLHHAGIMDKIYEGRMEVIGLYATAFKPLDQKHFLIAQLNTDAAHVQAQNGFAFKSSSITAYGSILYGWKKGDYRMMAIGASRTYRLGRPLIVPVMLYNQTFNDHWGVEALLPARGFVRYNFSTNSMLLAGFELEGGQFQTSYQVPGIGGWVDRTVFLQRGEIKPRLQWEKRLKGFFWLSAQAGYRINGRFNIVDRYDGQEKNEIYINGWGNSPYANIGIYFVSP